MTAKEHSQSDHILEIRLRQLARLGGHKDRAGLAKMRDERQLGTRLNDPALLRDAIIQEIEAGPPRFGDERRTLAEAAVAATTRNAAPTILDEPVTVILSEKGWIRTRQGYNLDPSALPFMGGDRLRAAIEYSEWIGNRARMGELSRPAKGRSRRSPLFVTRRRNLRPEKRNDGS